MSTRAYIRIKSESESISLFCCWDGDPSGIGMDLKRVLDNQKDWDVKDISRHLLQSPQINQEFLSRDRLFLTENIHGPEDYVYIIDTQTNTLDCFEHEMYETIEECCIESRRQDISEDW